MLTKQRCHELFVLKGNSLYWRIGNRTGPETGEQINIDGAVYFKKAVIQCYKYDTISQPPRTPTGVDRLPSGRYRARYHENNQRFTLGVFDTLIEAENALDLRLQA